MKLIYLLPAGMLLMGTGAVAHYTVAQSGVSPIMQSQSTIQPSSASFASTEMEKSDRPVGGLYVQDKEGKQVSFPLKHTEVKAKVSGNVSRVEVTQTFQNPFPNPLEAIYVFPLPDEAAVDDMEIKIGDRIIKGDIKKREEAREIYEQARQQGRTAGLLEQERDNIFTQSLANIKPGEQIAVTIRYSDSLKFEKGNYEFVFPMVVGPRYIPGTPIDTVSPQPEGVTTPSPDTDRVPDASRITPPVLKPGTRSGHDINVTVNIDAGVPIQDIQSTSHKLNVQREGNMVELQLSPEDTIPNKDLIVRYRVTSSQPQATVLVSNNERGGHFATYLIPAVAYQTSEIVPKDVVFLMDTSGSQSGDPILKSQELMRRFVNGLNPNDTFTIIDFANTTKQLSKQPLANTVANRQKAIAYIDQLDANGGTELLNGINAVMNFPEPEGGRVRSVVLLTDGYIGNDNEIIAAVQQQLKAGNRLYSFGVGSSVNRFLLNRLAEVGRGTVQVVRQDEPTAAVAEKFFQQINNPVLTNIQVTWRGSGEQPQIYPERAPDLFANQPLVLFGKKSDRLNGTLHITGTVAGNKRFEQNLPVSFGGEQNAAIAQLWGRFRIKDLMNQMFSGETKTLVDAVTQTALDYRLLSQYTAFVAVSEEVRVNPDGKTERVQVPVELPQGVSYEGIFGNDAAKDGNVAFGAMLAAPQASSSSGGRMARRNIPTAPPPVIQSITPKQAPSPSRQAAESIAESFDRTERKTNASQPTNKIQVVKIEGVSIAANTGITGQMTSAETIRIYVTDPLLQHLQAVNIPKGINGEIVLEFPLQNGRVGRVILDDQASTIKDIITIEILRRSLLTWKAPQAATGKVRLTLRISS